MLTSSAVSMQHNDYAEGCVFDARGKDIHRASHHSHMFGPRATYRTVRGPAALIIDNVRRHDEGLYRCRADFVNSESRTFSYNLSVIEQEEEEEGGEEEEEEEGGGEQANEEEQEEDDEEKRVEEVGEEKKTHFHKTSNL
ncbi:hypothetical protein M8J76_009093 [Diaphorina citri]|nr:hypothetical protein M8J76_009093 [Diaphorina citri]